MIGIFFKSYNAIIKFLNNTSFRIKLLLFFLVLTIFPFFILTIINSNTISREIQQQTLFTANKTFDQNIALLENKIENILEVSSNVAINESTIDILLSNKSEEYFNDLIKQNSDYVKLNRFLSSFQNNGTFQRLSLYIDNRFFFAEQNSNFYNLLTVTKKDWYLKLNDLQGQLQWFPTSTLTGQKSNSVSAIRKIRNLNKLTDVIGLVRIDIDKSLIQNIFSHSLITPNSKMYITNSANQIIVSNFNADQYYDLILPFEQIDTSSADKNIWNQITSSDKYLYSCRKVPHTDWKVILAIPSKDLLSTSIKSRNNIIVVAIIVTFCAYILAYFFSTSLTKRIKLLINHMKEIEDGNFDISILAQSRDEIGQLTKNFNYMLTKMSLLMDEKLSAGKEIKSAELKALQAQINPHFLYNTLDLIQWRAVNNNIPEISTLVKSLAKYYKLVLSKGEDTVSLSSEVEHVKTYVSIQNERFKNCIDLKINVESELNMLMVPKMLLQPLVENSIIHGLFEKTDIGGIISINAYCKDSEIYISVEDNGIGMTEQKCNNIFNIPTSGHGSHYGVKNIRDRLNLFFGKEATLTYKSSPGVGTDAIITIPELKANYM